MSNDFRAQVDWKINLENCWIRSQMARKLRVSPKEKQSYQKTIYKNCEIPHNIYCFIYVPCTPSNFAYCTAWIEMFNGTTTDFPNNINLFIPWLCVISKTAIKQRNMKKKITEKKTKKTIQWRLRQFSVIKLNVNKSWIVYEIMKECNTIVAAVFWM